MTESDREVDEHIDEDLIIDLVAGLVQGRERDRLLDHIGACRSCEECLIAAGGDWEAIRSNPAPEGWRERGRDPVLPGLEDPGRRVIRRMIRLSIPLSLAAAILVLVVTRIPKSPAENPTFWIPATGEILKLRGAHSTDADSTFWLGLNAYERHDVRTATARLKDAKASGGMEDLRRLHLASLLVNSGQGREAMDILTALEIEFLPLPWREDAGWIEYLALVELGQYGEADRRLAEMATWPGRIGQMARAVRPR